MRYTVMSNKNIIRAWKDVDYRQSLSEAERALLPEHPAGLIELDGAEIDGVAGGQDLKPIQPSSMECSKSVRDDGTCVDG
jgi:mersacidin/lichenicidin family type 2 lantibiotic